LQASPQIPVARQLYDPLATVGHGVHDVPQLAALVLDAQVLPQAWNWF
jgi:hypothetical protein